MTISDILNELQKRRIDIELAGKNIRLHGSEDDLDESLVESIRIYKKDIIDLLNSKSVQAPARCLGSECNDVRYEDAEGSLWLWCDHFDKAVIHLMECPQGHWQKDAKGFPLQNKG